MNKVYFLKLKGSEHFIVYDGSMEDEEMKNCLSVSITGNINYASKFTGYEAHNHVLVKSGVCDNVFIDDSKFDIDVNNIQLSIFD